MNIMTVKDVNVATAITHGGVFHADEVMSTVLLGKLFPEVKVCRVFRVPENVNYDVVVYDIGGGRFDHHYREFNEARENGTLYSSLGLLWREYGMQLLEKMPDVDAKQDVFKMFDRAFVEGIDATDNGQAKIQRDNCNVQIMTLSAVISSFNPNWNENVDSDICFMKAVGVAETIFDNALNSIIAKVQAKTSVEAAIERANSGIMILSEFMPWQEILFSSTNEKAKEILYVIFPSNRGGFNVIAVPDRVGGFGQRKPFPESWAALTGDALAKESGIATATFCHKARFICATTTFEDAVLVAQKAIAL